MKSTAPNIIQSSSLCELESKITRTELETLRLNNAVLTDALKAVDAAYRKPGLCVYLPPDIMVAVRAALASTTA